MNDSQYFATVQKCQIPAATPIRINPHYRGRRKIILSKDTLTLVLVLIALTASSVLSYFYYR